MNDREKWRERVKDIRAGGTTWKNLFQDLNSSRSVHFAITSPEPPVMYIYVSLLSFLLRCGTRPYERGTQWDSKICISMCVARRWVVSHINASISQISIISKVGDLSQEGLEGSLFKSYYTLDCSTLPLILTL